MSTILKVMKPIHPCTKDCKERKCGCASTCPRWKEYEEARNIFYKERIKMIERSNH